MLEIFGDSPRFCDRLSRRSLLRLGALAPLGLSLPQLLSNGAARAAGSSLPLFGRAKRCLLLFMWGGPAHQDTFDLKPNAPDGIRSQFKSIATKTPGVDFCEYLPKLAAHSDKLALVRSVTHGDNNHSTAAHWMLTGKKHRLSRENFGASDIDYPHLGSVLTKVAPARSQLPTFVALPQKIMTFPAQAIVPGQNGGMIGKQYDPFQIDGQYESDSFDVESLRLPAGIDSVRVRAREDLLKTIDAARPALDQSRQVAAMSSYYQQALDLVVSTEARRAFDLASETAADRDRYGRHAYGQSLLLARRLVEADVKLVTVYWHAPKANERPDTQANWDTHAKSYPQMKELLPQVDQPIAALLEDLSQRGLLDETLFVWFSEFGRGPRMNAAEGRDHWGSCNTIWLAGGGIPGGQVYGSSDRHAAYPDSHPVHPDDLSATIFHLLGVAPHTTIEDQFGRPLSISEGKPLERLFSATG